MSRDSYNNMLHGCDSIHRNFPAFLSRSKRLEVGMIKAVRSDYVPIQFVREKKKAPTWRITPVSKWLVTPIYKPFRPFGRGTTLLRGLTSHGY